ncbi:MAG: flagellar basal body L-ring protein FlgH [Spirochaetes bacterium]|nr:flagellar basal body L-ring protein FlgH [Spirochaetota bacterium]
MKRVIIISFLIFLFFSMFVFADSLWDDRAADIYNRKVYYKIGDSIQILINEQSAFEYKSSTKSLKSYKLNISGGEMSGLMDFVPSGNAEENKNSLDRDNLKIQSVIQARITRVANNYITITGKKQVQINNKISSVEISGDAYLSDIIGNSIFSNKLIDSSLKIISLIENDSKVITGNDLINVILNPDATSDIIEKTMLSDTKKKEMLLEYFNKILNVIF